MTAKEADATPCAAVMTRPLLAPPNLATPAKPRPSSFYLYGVSSENDLRAAFDGEGVSPTSAVGRLAGVLESEISNNKRAREDHLDFDKRKSARGRVLSVEKEKRQEKRLALEEQNNQVLALRVQERAEEASVRAHEAAKMERQAAKTEDDRDYELKKQEANRQDRESDGQARARIISMRTLRETNKRTGRKTAFESNRPQPPESNRAARSARNQTIPIF